MLQFIWNNLAYIGIHYLKEQSEHKYVLLVNGTSLLLILLLQLTVMIFYFIGMRSIMMLITFSFTILTCFTFYFNSKGKFTSARIYLVLLCAVYIFTLSILVGNLAKIHTFLLVEILFIYFSFPPKDSNLKNLFVLFLFILYIIFAFGFEKLKPIVSIPEQFHYLRSLSVDLLFGAFLLVFSIYIHNTFLKSELSVLIEHEKSQKLLKNILPSKVITQLRENNDSIADRYENCTVLFSDLVGFTQLSREMSASTLVKLLNDIFSSFDDLADKYKLEKIKTIGDAYMVVGGIPDEDENHAESIAFFALEMLEIINDYNKKNNLKLEIRIGINSGSAVAGVIGKRKFIYDLWGESVNTASRMESHGVPGGIHVSETTYFILKDKFKFKEREKIDVKGIGLIQSYILEKTLF